MAVSTDLIVGFPGETDEDFEATLDLVRQAQFSFIFSFAYSKRKGTAAQRFKDRVAEETKKARLAELNRVQDAITIRQNQAEIGKERDILVHYASKRKKTSTTAEPNNSD